MAHQSPKIYLHDAKTNLSSAWENLYDAIIILEQKEISHPARIKYINQLRSLTTTLNRLTVDLINITKEYPFLNPVTSIKISDPTKFIKKQNWWIINLYNPANQLVKSIVIPFRTKTEAKLFIKSNLGKTYESIPIASAVLEGPYKSITDATAHKAVK